MGKPKFSVGEFVDVVGYRTNSIFYIYDYISGSSHPYHIISLKRHYRYRAKAKNLKRVTSIMRVITYVLFASNSRVSAIQVGNSHQRMRLDGEWTFYPHILSESFSLRR